MNRLFLHLVATLFVLISGGTLLAAEPSLPEPKGPVILTVSGKIARGNGTDSANRLVARFDRAMLDALAKGEIVTETPWHDGEPRFAGPKASALIAAVQASGDVARAIALNDFVVDIPTSEWQQDRFILALTLNGAPMPVREKGPIFVIYNYRGVPKEQVGLLYNKSIWQLSRVEFR